MRQILLLDTQKMPDSSYYVKYVFWLAAPANRVRPWPNFVSSVPLVSAVSWGVTPTELVALQSGSFVEVSGLTGNYVSTTSESALATDLQTQYSAMQSSLNETSPPIKLIGSYYDGTSWTIPT